MELAKVKWFKTTGGKIGIVIGTLAAVTGIVLLVNYVKNRNKPNDSANETKPGQTTDQNKTETTTTTTTPTDPKTQPVETAKSDLPNNGVGCGPIRTAFDRVYNYVKCGNIWYTISKDKIKIPNWKSLAENKTATNLLNNKYPA